MTFVLALAAGGALGYVFERGDFCFHSTWRGLFRTPPDHDLFRAYLLLLVISTPVVQVLVGLDVIDPFIPEFAWKATILGGLVFGVGMAIASSCITGFFYKTGHGMLGSLLGIAAWAVGDVITIRGPLSGLRDDLVADPVRSGDDAATLATTLGPLGPLVAVIAVVGGAVFLFRRRKAAGAMGRDRLWGWIAVGAASAGVILATWLLAAADSQNYPFGTSGVPTQVWDWIRGRSTGSWWIPVALAALTPGAFIAAKRSGSLWVRGETGPRYAQLAGGGLLMGIGAGIAGGCNLGHGMVGVPLLSWGSISATAAMATGIFVAAQLLPSTPK